MSVKNHNTEAVLLTLKILQRNGAA